MSSRKLAQGLEKELTESFDIKEVFAEEEAKESDMIFFIEGTQEREKIKRGHEEVSPTYSEDRVGSLREYRKKRKLFWHFIVNFFMSNGVPLKKFIGCMEKNIILRALSRVNGNQKYAAEILGVKYTTLNEKIKKYNIKFFKTPIKD